MNKLTKAGQLAKSLMDEYPTAGSLTLAKRLYQQYPEYYQTVENARGIIRNHRGVNGAYNRKKLLDLRNVKDIDKVLADKFALPEPAVNKREPYILPKANKNILVMSDVHFPFQNNEGIIEALEYGVRKQVDTIILNGDMLDMYQVSRFVKDGRKPSVEYEIEMFYEFLVNLRAIFPNTLIIWKYGNHEERWDIYMKANAPLLYMTGTNCLEDTMPLGDLNIVVVKDKRRIIAADLNILHGHEYGTSAGSVNPARMISLRAKVNTLIGHYHRTSSHKERDLNGNVSKYHSLGAMCVAQDYAPYGNQDCSYGHLQTEDGKCYVQIREI